MSAITNKARLAIHPVSDDGRTLRLSAALEHPNGSTDTLWWEVPNEWRDAITTSADPWVIALLFPMMQSGAPVHVEGTVSPSLLRNIELFMRIWNIWAPDKYRPVEISADREEELATASESGRAIASFSCGVDSCFTLLRHIRGLAGRRTQPVGATVLQHGLDVWLDQPNNETIYERMYSDARFMSESLGVPCIPVKTNFQQMRLSWADSWGTQQVAGLHLFAARYDSALIANEIPYHWIGIPWASNPLTNALLGSRGFAVVDDGGDYSRSAKAQILSAWPEAMERLHVCFGVKTPGSYGNCCTCEKCIRTILAFRISGVRRPFSFARDPTDAEIRRVRIEALTKLKRWEQLAHEAEAAGFGQTSWAGAIRSVVRKTRWRNFRNGLQQPFVPIRNRIRLLTRGTPKSRSEVMRAADLEKRDPT